MKINKGFIIGTMFGFGLSFCISFLFMFIAQGLAGGVTSLLGESWLYYATIIPFTLTFAVLGMYFSNRQSVSNKKLWLLGLITALFITLFSGTVGALFREYVASGGSLRTYNEFGYSGVNIEGVLVWGTIYAFILLPLTVPLARLIIHLFIQLLKKFKVTP